MYPITKEIQRKRSKTSGTLDLIRTHIAASMIGQAVDLLLAAGKTTHGVVTGVQLENGEAKIVVAGSRYKLDQVLTVTPATLN